MSTIDNTTTKADVYQKVTDAIIQAIRARCGRMAYALAHVRQVRILAGKRHKQESLSGRQRQFCAVGFRTSEGL